MIKKLQKTIVILGDRETGKTNIIKKYIKKKFDERYKETIGVDFYSKEMISANGNIWVNLWDTSGTEINNKILPSQIYKITNGFIICSSYDNINSLDEIEKWIDYAKKCSIIDNGSSEIRVPIILIFNKFDLKRKQFSQVEIKNKLYQISFIYNVDNFYVCEGISAKDDLNLNFAFENILNLLTGNNIKTDSYIFYNINDSLQKDKKSFRLDPKCKSCKKKGCCS